VAKLRKADAVLNDTFEGRSNDSLNPTGNSAAFIRKTWMLGQILPGGLIRALGTLRIYKTVELNVTEQIEEIRSMNGHGERAAQHSLNPSR
jgi:hypothetical protein